MRRKILMSFLICAVSASVLCACGNKTDSQTEPTETVESTESENSSGGSASLDTDTSATESEESEESTESDLSDLPPEDATTEDAAPVEKPETIKFVIVQGVRDKMFTLTNTEKQTLTIDTASDSGYTGTMKPSSGEYETGASGYYTIPYTSFLTLSDMDDEIVYVSAEYPHALSVAVQKAATVVLNEDRSVVITGKDDTTVFSYRVWMPSFGVKKEKTNEIMQGQGSGSIKLFWDGSKVSVEQLTGSPVSQNSLDADASELDTVDWRTACPWADKITTGVWSDGADLSNAADLQKGIMNAKFTPVSEIEEDGAKVSKLTFYDSNKKKLGTLNFWQTGNHVEIDGKKFDYDTFGLE